MPHTAILILPIKTGQRGLDEAGNKVWTPAALAARESELGRRIIATRNEQMAEFVARFTR